MTLLLVLAFLLIGAFWGCALVMFFVAKQAEADRVKRLEAYKIALGDFNALVVPGVVQAAKGDAAPPGATGVRGPATDVTSAEIELRRADDRALKYFLAWLNTLLAAVLGTSFLLAVPAYVDAALEDDRPATIPVMPPGHPDQVGGVVFQDAVVANGTPEQGEQLSVSVVLLDAQGKTADQGQPTGGIYRLTAPKAGTYRVRVDGGPTSGLLHGQTNPSPPFQLPGPPEGQLQVFGYR